MVSEMVKKQGMARFYFSCKYFCRLYLLRKMLLVKLKNFQTSAWLNLNYGITKQSQKCKGSKDGGIYQNVWPMLSQI